MSLPRVDSLDSIAQHVSTSSLSNIYNQYEMHINILKWTGVVVLLALTASTLGVTSNLYTSENPHHNESDYIKKYPSQPFNSSLCSYIKPFQLPNAYFLTLCKYKASTIVDIRQFLNNKPTVRGIALTSNQLNYLLSIKQHVSRAIYQSSNSFLNSKPTI